MTLDIWDFTKIQARCFAWMIYCILPNFCNYVQAREQQATTLNLPPEPPVLQLLSDVGEQFQLLP
jgi:hypothetical protein